MPYDDTDVKKMIRYQLERKVGFSKSKKISDDAKHLIHAILEAKVDQRATIAEIKESPWLQAAYRALRAGRPTASAPSSEAEAPVFARQPSRRAEQAQRDARDIGVSQPKSRTK